MRLPVPRSTLRLVALIALAPLGMPTACRYAQSSRAAPDQQQLPRTYDIVIRSEGATWEGSVVVFPDSAIVTPNAGGCLELMRPLRRLDVNSEAWPCYGLLGVHQFVIVIDRRNPPKAWWFPGSFEHTQSGKAVSVCALNKPNDLPPICAQFNDRSVQDASVPRGVRELDLIPRIAARP